LAYKQRVPPLLGRITGSGGIVQREGVVQTNERVPASTDRLAYRTAGDTAADLLEPAPRRTGLLVNSPQDVLDGLDFRVAVARYRNPGLQTRTDRIEQTLRNRPPRVTAGYLHRVLH
jgi:hypothetical protein